MSSSLDPRPLNAFFREVQENLNIELIHTPDNEKFPIQLKNTEGISRVKSQELLMFIKGQIDLRDNEICKIHTIQKSPLVTMELTQSAAKALSDVYALSFFFDSSEEEEEEPKS